ncbi:MAG: 4'-phosphopantetheinyl transferase superfamily protein [Oscillospiraceae bacterium]|nr:4'-phosphopantetheinyl transferase superfamily protein [Oscillospiraceae bacterium]
MFHVYYADSTTLPQEVLTRWLPRIDPQKALRIRRMHLSDAKASMTGELLLRYGMRDCFSIPPSELRTGADANGKPQVLSHPGVYFNISHSGGHCICAVSDHPVGADLQQIRPVRFCRLAQRFFTPAEWAAFQAMGETEDAFFTLWARKEALGKLTGLGLRQLDRPAEGVIVLEENFQNCKICVMTSP